MYTIVLRWYAIYFLSIGFVLVGGLVAQARARLSRHGRAQRLFMFYSVKNKFTVSVVDFPLLMLFKRNVYHDHERAPLPPLPVVAASRRKSV